MQHVIQDPSTNKINFHACMWGSRRNKKTSFLTNSSELESLRKTCNHQKWEHDSWGVKWVKNRWKFATEDECEYPLKHRWQATSHRPKESKDPGTAARQRQSAPPSGNSLGDTLAQRPYRKDNHQNSSPRRTKKSYPSGQPELATSANPRPSVAPNSRKAPGSSESLSKTRQGKKAGSLTNNGSANSAGHNYSKKRSAHSTLWKPNRLSQIEPK